jgi:putative oxidoreductase
MTRIKNSLKSIDNLLDPLRNLATLIGLPLLLLWIRVYMALIFLKSGLIKFGTWQNGNFDSTIYLFKSIHVIPGVDPVLAAYMALIGEITLPILLILGFMGRFAAAGLLVMTLTIQFLVGGDFYLNEHYYWMMLLAVPLVIGSGTLSVDALLRFFLRGCKTMCHVQHHHA